MSTRLPTTITLELGPPDGTAQEFELVKGAVHSWQLAPDTTLRMRAVAGAFWITVEGDPADYVINCGETLTFTGPGLLVAEGLAEANELEHHEIAPVAV